MDKLKNKLKKGLGLGPGKTPLIPGTGQRAFTGQANKLGTTETPKPPQRPPSNTQHQATVPQPPSTASRPSQPSPLTLPAPTSIPSSSHSPVEVQPLPVPKVAAPEAVTVAFNQLSADPQSSTAAQVLSRLLGNIIADPSAAKYRRVRLSNPKIQSAVVDTDGGVELLLACGFHILFEKTPSSGATSAIDSSNVVVPPAQRVTDTTHLSGEEGGSVTAGGGSGGCGGEDIERENTALLEENGQAAIPEAEEQEEGYAVLPEDSDLEPIYAALHLLQRLSGPACIQRSSSAAPSGAAAAPQTLHQTSTASGNIGNPAAAIIPQVISQALPQGATVGVQKEREWSPPRDRSTRIILPTSINTDVPQWFFERTGKDIKAALLSAMKQREDSQVLMTRATRERLAAQRGGAGTTAGSTTVATVKVRLPEGIAVQGEFSPGEPVAAVFGWMATCLTDPLQTYDLVLPDRKTLVQYTMRGTAQRQLSVKEAGLVPSVTLNLRWTGPSAVAMKTMPALRMELLQEAGQS